MIIHFSQLVIHTALYVSDNSRGVTVMCGRVKEMIQIFEKQEQLSRLLQTDLYFFAHCLPIEENFSVSICQINVSAESKLPDAIRPLNDSKLCRLCVTPPRLLDDGDVMPFSGTVS